MILVEKIQILSSHKEFKSLMEKLHLSKNLYNAALYDIRQHFFNTGEYKSWMKVSNEFISKNQQDFRALPSHLSQKILKKIGEQFSSFFALLEKKKNGMYDKKIKIPDYKKFGGNFMLEWEGRLISQPLLRKGVVNPLGTNLKLNFRNLKFTGGTYSDGKLKTNIKQIRLIPVSKHQINVEICYEIKEPTIKEFNGTIAGIDLGINNLFTVGINNKRGFLIKGTKLKSINQYYNKKLSVLQSELQTNYNKNKKSNDEKTSNAIIKLTRKRNNKILDFLHKSTRILVNQLVESDVAKVVIGKNIGWKQDIKIGKRNNQNFVYIPHSKAIKILCYKLKMKGIEVEICEESYTSKASFIDMDDIPVYGKNKTKQEFSGKRIHRGLYISMNGTKINADLNGALNILRKSKVKSNKFDIQACSFMPLGIHYEIPKMRINN